MTDTIMTMTEIELRATLMGLARTAPEATAEEIRLTLAVTRKGAGV